VGQDTEPNMPVGDADETKAATLMQKLARGKVARKEMQDKKNQRALASAESVPFAVPSVATSQGVEMAEADTINDSAVAVDADAVAEAKAATHVQKLARGKLARKEAAAAKAASQAAAVTASTAPLEEATVSEEEQVIQWCTCIFYNSPSYYLYHVVITIAGAEPGFSHLGCIQWRLVPGAGADPEGARRERGG
jgi:hypothetical protein